MILFLENGRIGNQLFQYHGLKKYFPEHKLVFWGCKALRSISSDLQAVFVDKPHFISPFLFLCFTRLLLVFSNLRIFGCISEDTSSESYRLLVRKGLIFNLYVSNSLFFQHLDCVDHLVYAPALNADLVAAAHSWLFSRGLNHNSDHLVFVHIRRGDYLRWPSAEAPAVLPCSWYLRAIELIQAKFPNSVFIFLSDDVMYLEDIFGSSPFFHISHNTSQVDLAIMSICNSGILSASSFAWWGAYYSRIVSAYPSLFIAPEFWCGHRIQAWYPKNFKVKWITYLK